jgi:hypothetical protein
VRPELVTRCRPQPKYAPNSPRQIAFAVDADDPSATKLDPGLPRRNVTRPRAADDFATIRARMEELRREREYPQATESDSQRDPPSQHARSLRWPPPEIGAGLGRVRQSGSGGG